jgi:hypothetical protein
MLRPNAPVLLAAAAAALSACGGDGAGSWEGTVSDSAGVEVVLNTGAGTWSGEDAWTVEPDLVIGQAEGEPEYQFGQITGIDVGSDGRIYVIDQQASEVRVFGPGGEFEARMGKAGAGPGELSQAAGPLFVGPGDTVAVADVPQQRVTRWGPDGESAGSYPIPMTEGIPTRWMEAPNQDLIQQAMVMQFPGQETTVEPKNLILRRAPSGEITDTLLTLPIGKTMSFAGGRPDITLFESEPMWAMGPDGRLYFGNNSEYRLEVYSTEGELQRVIAKDVERRPVTEGDQNAFRQALRDIWSQQGVPPQAIEAMSQGLKFASNYPAYMNVLGGPGGTLWVQGVQTPESVQESGADFNIQDLGSTDWEVFDDEGRLMGTVIMPQRFTPLMFIGDHIYGVLRDELDVQYAARMAVKRGGGDLAG